MSPNDLGIMVGGCGADAATCLSGTVTAMTFAVAAQSTIVQLYATFPGQNATPSAVQSVGAAGAWAFAGLSPWTHYYVQVVAAFNGVNAVSAVAGPFSIPSNGVPIAVDVKPVAFQILESRVPGGPRELVLASASVYDPSSGAPVTGDAGAVSVEVADASFPLAWSASQMLYVAEPSPPLAAQPSYVLTVSMPPESASPSRFQVSGNPPMFDGALVSLASANADGASPLTLAADAGADAALSAGEALTVDWQAQPAADYVELELFELTDVADASAWTSRYASPAPNPSNVTEEVIPASAVTSSGEYLLDVVYATAACPAASGGCVESATVAAQTFGAR